MYARHFYITSWWENARYDIDKSLKDGAAQSKPRPKKKKKRNIASSVEEVSSYDTGIEEITPENHGQLNFKVLSLVEARRNFLQAKIRPFSDPISARKTET